MRKAILVLVLCLGLAALLGFSIPPQGQWAIVGATPKQGGFSQAIVGTSDSIYILRGHQSDDPIYFWECPIEKSGDSISCRTLTPPAEGKGGVFQNGVALTWDGDHYIYALTGRFYKQEGKNELWRYDLTSREWDNLGPTTVEGQLKRQGPGNALAYVEQDGRAYLYAFFGAARSSDRAALNYNGFLRYDIEADKWEELPKLWDCTDDGAALAWDGNGYIYALRGSDCGDDPTRDFARFDLAQQQWDDLSTQTTSLKLPQPVNDGGSLVFDGERYLYALSGGAFEGGSDGKGFYRLDVEELESWEELPKLPCPVGYYVGNRLAFVNAFLLAWQGSPAGERWECDQNTTNLSGQTWRQLLGRAIMRYWPQSGGHSP